MDRFESCMNLFRQVLHLLRQVVKLYYRLLQPAQYMATCQYRNKFTVYVPYSWPAAAGLHTVGSGALEFHWVHPLDSKFQ